MCDGNEWRAPEYHWAVKGSLAFPILNLSDTDTFYGSINDLIVINVHWFCTFTFCRALLESEAKVAQKKLKGRGQLAGLVLAAMACAQVGLRNCPALGQQEANPPHPFWQKCSPAFVCPPETPWKLPWSGGLIPPVDFKYAHVNN